MKLRSVIQALSMALLIGFGSINVYAGTDSDGVPDASDFDADNDGILNTDEGICTPPSAPLNSSNYALDTPLQNTPGLPLTFFGGAVTLDATLTGTAAWTGGIQVKNDPVEGDYLFVQPNNANNYYNGVNTATYTFDFSEPVQNLVLNPGGLNFEDGTTITAFIDGTPITIDSSNYSNLTAGMLIQTNDVAEDTVVGPATNGGIDVLGNDYTLTIPGPVDQLVIETGKVNGATSNVTLGFSGISWDCISLDTDLDGIPDYLDTDSDGDMCADANEAYSDPNTDSNSDGTFGGVVGPGQVNGDGTVIGAPYSAPATTGGETTFQEGITLNVDADPTQQSFAVGSTADFTATASSATVVNDPTVTTSTQINYQWQVSTDGGTTFTDVTDGTNGSGTTTSGSSITYTTAPLTLGDENNLYRVVVTNAANICGATSAAADFNAPFAELNITKDDGETTYTPGEPFTYTINITNNGPDAADGTVFTDNIPSWGESVSWSCAAANGAVCPNASGSGNAINETIATLPNNGTLTYTISGIYSADMANYP